ncbi:uncharacterized protein LOC6046875 [Culex quinquefasciatus]|uniref:uncharacterized protein LOC6046875 n=1 Tax=Culex quinquefasciatus TaxID=7176 RepID=UPI0018E3B393|nr:uncharacterized protein LOC6046875 [Culex quinquefasciatus]XP_039443094.1 uncharacterized protein LOC120423376 [Culex pipiens pallens]
MVSIMDIDPTRQICDNRSTLSQSAVSQKSIDLEIPIPLKSPTSTTSPTSPLSTTAAATDTELAKRAMKLDLTEVQAATGSCSQSATATESIASGSGISSAASTATTTHSSTSNSAATTTTAIIMKHRKLKERTFSDELGSPKSPAATVEVVDDRKALRDALYQGIFHRHRRTIFAVGSFLRMLKSRNSSYNTIRSSSEGEDDTR